MKEVYVLCGRKRFHEGVFDQRGNYFDESPIVEVFDNFDDAKTKLKEYAIEAYNYMKLCGAGYIVGDDFIEETTEADLFSCYYMTPSSSTLSSSLPNFGNSPSTSKSTAIPCSFLRGFTLAYLIAESESTADEKPATSYTQTPPSCGR